MRIRESKDQPFHVALLVLAGALGVTACSRTTEVDACWQARAEALASTPIDTAGDWRARAMYLLDSLAAAGDTSASGALFFYDLYGPVERAWMATHDSVVVYEFYTLPNVIVVRGRPAALMPLVPYERLQLMEVAVPRYAELDCR